MDSNRSFTHIRVEKDNLTGIWLSRPEKKNAINGLMAAELMEAFRYLADDPDVSVVLLRGEGDIFCAGGDLHWMTGKTQNQEEQAATVLGQLYRNIYFFPKPLVMLVHGSVLGGALGLVSCADFVVAESATMFSFSEVRLGLIPATISPYVIAKTGQNRAMQLMLSGKTIQAEEAKASGLVDIFAEKQQAETACMELTAMLLKNAPGAMRACKQLVRNIAGLPLDEKLTSLTTKALGDVIKGDEAKEGIIAFREKREPQWRKS